MENTHTSYLVAGASGNLGRRIIDALLRSRPGSEIRAAVCGGSAGKHAINPYLDMRRTFDRKVAPSGIGYTHILNGGFMEAVFSNPGLIDAEAGTITDWEDDGRGSIADGYAELRRMAKAGAHPMAMLPLQYLLPMMSGEGTLRDIANDQYPTVRPTSLLDFMKRHYITRGK